MIHNKQCRNVEEMENEVTATQLGEQLMKDMEMFTKSLTQHFRLEQRADIYFQTHVRTFYPRDFL